VVEWLRDEPLFKRVNVPADLFARVRDEWVAHALSTEPADRAAAEAGVRAAYRAAKLDPPRIVVWLGSPLAGVLGARFLDVLLDRTHPSLAPIVLGTSVAGELRGGIGLHPNPRTAGPDEWVTFRTAGEPMSLAEQVDVQVRPVWNVHIGQVLAEPVPPSMGDEVEARIRERAPDLDERSWRLVWDADPAQVRKWRTEQCQAAIDGQAAAGRLADHEVNRHLRKRSDKRVPPLLRVARSAGPWWAMYEAAVLTERPTELHRDDRGRPHRADGPAIRYPDGWTVHAWHGVHVPADLIEGDGWPSERIMSEPDSKLRRCAVERQSAARD
jgi:hypothetical protein